MNSLIDLPHMSCRTVGHRRESGLGNDAVHQTDITDREQVKRLVDDAVNDGSPEASIELDA